jgi:hypothetical protein
MTTAAAFIHLGLDLWLTKTTSAGREQEKFIRGQRWLKLRPRQPI